MNPIETDSTRQKRLLKMAFLLGIFTIVFNIIEGVVSTYFGYTDDTLTLFGFGVDSFIEAISAIGILNMIMLIRRNDNVTTTNFEKTALRITGYSFYFLTAGLLISSGYNLYTGSKPQTTFWGIVVSCISIVVMAFLVAGKRSIGKKLNSEPIIADANCTMVCIYMSVVLLLSSGIYELTHFAYMDIIGSLGIAFLSFREGRECFEKIKSGNSCQCGTNQKC